MTEIRALGGVLEEADVLDKVEVGLRLRSFERRAVRLGNKEGWYVISAPRITSGCSCEERGDVGSFWLLSVVGSC